MHFLNEKYYAEPSPDHWSGRTSDGLQYYLHEKIETKRIDILKPTNEKSIAILGYATDEGVKRNQGRPGAVDGPKAIRSRLSRLSNHLSSDIRIIDVGDIICPDGQMENAQENLSNAVNHLLGIGYHPIVIGGGHDIALGHFKGISSHLRGEKSIGIINFDAHLDLRKPIESGNSGTPFHQISEIINNQDFHYMAIGIQEIANHRGLIETAETKGVEMIYLDDCEIQNTDSMDRIISFINKIDHIYITIDLDGFSSAYSPGVSAPSPLGLEPKFVMRVLDLLFKSEKVISVDLAEMSPNYDTGESTAKLASALIYQCIKSY